MGDDDEQSEAVAAATDVANDIIQNIFQEFPPNPEDECRCNLPQCKELLLSRELDNILSPKLIIRHPSQQDKIWPLLTNKRMDVTSFLELLAEYRIDRHCGVVWPSNCVAYRCRTCSDSPTMSLCTDCFRAGNHESHNYNMFKSSSGGACDCGYSIMKESGHCKNHGKNALAKRALEQVPEELLCVPRRSMPRLIHRLAIQLRRSIVDMAGEVDLYLDYLIQLANSSAVMRSLMIDALISDKHYFSQLNLLINHPDKEVSRIVSEGIKKLKQEQKGLLPFKIPESWNPPDTDINAFCDTRPISCFAEELTFWAVIFEFPQKLICFLLGFLMDDNYKQILARAFTNQYPRIVMILAGAKSESRIPRSNLRDSYEQLFRRILQISAQIYTDCNLTKTLCDEEYTLHTLIYCLRAAIEGVQSESLRGVLKFNPLCPFSGSTPKVICFDKLMIRDRHLGSFTEDLVSILGCEFAAKRFMSNEDLLNTWLEMQGYFQTMSPHKRELTEHTPYETGPHVSVFTVESDFCLSPLWSILHHLRDLQALPLTKSLLQSIHANLSIWFHKMGIGPNSLLDPYYMSFHIPLHRMFAAALRHIIFIQKQPDKDIYSILSDNQLIFGKKYGYKSALGTPTVITINDFFKILLLHPLQALTLYHETRSSMWTRNGLMTINQAVNYVHCVYSYSTVDLDMFSLRYCASKLNPNYFLKIIMSRFHAWKWLSFKSNILMNNASDSMRQLYNFNILPEQITQMVESSLLTIIQLITLNLHCNTDEESQVRQEMVALIAVLDRSYSYLVDMLPERNLVVSHSNDKIFTKLLDELTIYKPAQHAGGNLTQGCYTLKPNIWDDEYDPISVQYRFYQKRDYQMSLERFFQHAKLNGKLGKRYHSSTLWPPLRVPRSIGNFGQLDVSPLIECPSLVGLVFSVIYKNLYIVDVPDTIMAYSIHLLELSLRKCLEKKSQPTTVEAEIDEKPELNQTFTGKFCYRELTSCPSYFGSKGEAYVKGSTIFSKPPTQSDESESVDIEGVKLFPVVRHALDLAFDTTWFPFKSVMKNCLVHIENVYSLPWKQFEIVLNCQPDSDGQTDQKNQQASTNSTDAMMSWAGESDVGIDEVEDGEDDFEDGDDEEEDEEEEDEEDDDDDDQDDSDGEQTVGPTSLTHHQNVLPPDTDSDSEVMGLIRQRDTQADSRISSQLRRTQDRATNTQSFWSAGEGYLQTSGATTAVESTTSQNLTRTTNTNTTTQSSSGSQRLCSVFVRQPQTALQSAALRPGSWSGEIDLHSPQGGQDTVRQQQQQQQQQGQDSEELRQVDSQSTNPAPMNVDFEDVEMITVSYEQITQTTAPDEMLRLTNIQMLNDVSSNTSDSSLDSLTYHLADSATETSLPQPSPSTSGQVSSRLPVVVNVDHTYSANSADTSMEVESSPTTRPSGGPLSLVPFNQEQRVDSAEQAGQMYPENLVTERRVLLASDPRSMITGNAQLLTLEASSGQMSQQIRESSRVHHHTTLGDEEQSLSEVDIQTRFMGFFQSRDQSRPITRGFRQRQMARRGGFRGPVPPFAVHNPNSTQSPSRQAHPTSDLYGRSRQTARRSNACFLLNRTVLSRSQQDQFNRRLRKDRMHHGESLLTLLLRLHAKYAQKARSYEYNEQRAQLNRSRIGDGVHFVTIVLDLICSLDQRMKIKLEQLQELIWPDKEGERANRHRKGSQTDVADMEQIQVEGGDREVKPARDTEELAGEVKCDDIGLDIKTNSPSSLNPNHRLEPQQQQQQHQLANSQTVGRENEPRQTSHSISGQYSDSTGAFRDDATTCSASLSTITASSAMLSPSERRKRAKEFQRKLMAEFTEKQRAFIEKYESSSSHQQTAHSKTTSTPSTPTRADKVEPPRGPDEEPINLSSKLSQETKPQMSDYDKRGQQQSNSASSSSRPGTSRGAGGASSSGSGSGSIIACPTVDKSLGDDGKLMTAIRDASGLLSSESKRTGGGDERGSGKTACEASCSTVSPAHYECCICGVDGPSDLANPLGQVVLLQSTSIYGHSHLRAQEERRLPCEESHYLSLKEETYAKYLERRIDLLCEHFSESSWLDSINIGAEGGVHVQSCGHYLHIECHQSYIKSLDQEDRLRTRNDSDEFLCPVCRQLANSVLPILRDIRRPERLSLALVESGHFNDQIALIGALLEQRLPPNQKELQSSAAFCSHLTKATGPQYRLVRSTASMHSLFLFLTSIARTNLECELIVRSTKRAQQSAIKRSCFQLLFHVLALNAQTLINQQWFSCDQIWSHLTHRADEKNRLSVKPMNSEVPLLLRDPIAILLQFLFAITNSLCYRTNFTCLVQILFNLSAFQSIALVLSYVEPQQMQASLGLTRDQPFESTSSTRSASSDFRRLTASIATNLSQLLAPTTEEPLMNATVRACYARLAGNHTQLKFGSSLDLIENLSKLACLPFLRAAALIQHHLYEQPYPNLVILDDHKLSQPKAIEEDFSALVTCLDLNQVASEQIIDPSEAAAKCSLAGSVRWPPAAGQDGAQLVANWSNELLRFGAEFSIAARSLLLSRSMAWYRPALMKLPRAFDDVFLFYYRKKCTLCHQVPKDVAICLVCGAPICFRVSCCKDRTRSRQAHSQHCGANTAVFLAVHTSSIVVIRGSRACVWGSVYLDAHDEEDNGLQRGKPLYLVQERFDLLEEQWLTHSFDHTCGKRWIYLQENQ